MARSRLPQEVLMQKLKVLMPDAKCSIRPYDNNEHLVANPVMRGSFLLDWHPDNALPCPSSAAINAVTDRQVSDMEEAERKAARNDMYAEDLRMKAAYRNERRANPDLSFSDYLDQLEAEEV